MNDTQIAALILILGGAGAMYLHGQEKLGSAVSEVLRKDTFGYPLGKLAIAFLILLFLLSVIPPDYGVGLVILIAFGALEYDKRIHGNRSFLNQIFGGSNS